MISEITISEVSAEYVSHATFVSKINELIRAQNTAELAATDSQQLKAEIAALIPVLNTLNVSGDDFAKVFSVMERMRQLSAV